MSKTYTEKQQLFLDSLISCGGDIREAMTEAGYSTNVSTTTVISSLEDEIIDVAKRAMAANAVKASIGMGNVLTDPTQVGANQKLNAAKEILDRVGIIKKEAPTVIGEDFIVILPAKKQ